MPLLKCGLCSTTNRIPSILNRLVRCGKCHHVFTPAELIRASPEPATSAGSGFGLEPEDDTYFRCKDDSCGWEGPGEDCDENPNGKLTCPDCGKRVKEVKTEDDDED